jgi:uncharacterized protein with WD repeat
MSYLAGISKDYVDIYQITDPMMSPETSPLSPPATLYRTLPTGLLSSPDAFAWNSDGTLCAVINSANNLTIYSFPSFDLVMEIPAMNKGIKAFYFSPKSTYILVCDRFEVKSPDTDNCAVYDFVKKSKIAQFKVKRLQSPLWPAMIWSEDEQFSVKVEETRIVSKRERHTDSAVIDVAASTVALSNTGYLAVFIARGDAGNGNGTGNKARVDVYNLSDSQRCGSFILEDPADSCTMIWNTMGDVLLISATVEVDVTGKNYYGKSYLYVYTVKSGLMSKPEIVESPLHDFKWLQRDGEGENRDESPVFIAVTGVMPANVGVFKVSKESGRVNKERSMGSAISRNMIRVQPHYSHYAIVGGFGALPGDIDFWDIKEKKVLSTIRAECVVDCAWNPHGNKLFLTSTTAPRMRVDNCMQLFDVSGNCVWKKEYKAGLFAGFFRPSKVPGIADSPTPMEILKKGTDEPRKMESNIYRAPGTQGSVLAKSLLERAENVAEGGRRKRVGVGSGVGNGGVGVGGGVVEKPKSKWDEMPDRFAEVLTSAGAPAAAPALAAAAPAPLAAATPAPVASSKKSVSLAPPVSPPSSPPPPAPPANPPPSILIPCPENDWFYKDLQGKIQGPFALKLMLAWSKAGYFNPSLEIKVGSDRPFLPLSTLFPSQAFGERMIWPYHGRPTPITSNK